MLLRDERHVYEGYWSPGAVCRVRIYAGTPATAGLPVVIVTQVPENQNTSITNLCEYLAAEILTRYLPQQDGAEPPYVYIEHYPDDCQYPQIYHPGGRHQASYAQEHFEYVTFEHTNPDRTVVFGPRERWKFGQPVWRRIEQAELEALIGQPWTPEYEADYPPAPSEQAHAQ